MRALGPLFRGHQIHIIERTDAVGHWFPFSYMVRTPDGDWLDFETVAAAHEHLESLPMDSRTPDATQRDFAEQLDSMFPRP
jgi:hypothetical protein